MLLRTLTLPALLLVGSSCSREAGGTAAREGFVITNPSTDRDYFHDFGRVLYGEKVTRVFELENREGVPIRVEDLQASCSCTVPTTWYLDDRGERVLGSRTQKPVLVVPPGKTLHVACAIDTTRVEKPNVDKLSQVRMRSNSLVTPYVTFEMHLVVVRPFRAVPEVLDLRQTPQSRGKSVRTDVSTALANDPARIVQLERVEGPFEATVEHKVVGAENLWIVTATAHDGLSLGPLLGKVVLSTSVPGFEGAGPPFEIPVRATVVPDVVAEPGLLALKPREDDGLLAGSFDVVALVPGERVLVLGAAATGAAKDELDVAFEPVGADDSGRAGRWKVTARAKPGAKVAQGTLEVVTDHAHVSLVRVPFAGQAK